MSRANLPTLGNGQRRAAGIERGHGRLRPKAVSARSLRMSGSRSPDLAASMMRLAMVS